MNVTRFLFAGAALVALLLAPPMTLADADERQIVLAGGCFWCMQPPYDRLDGVIRTEVGFAGGDVENPSYEEVIRGGTGHYEVVRVTYDPEQVTYDELLEVFWRNVDPLDDGGQFCDRGDHYRAAIFVDSDEQRAAAEASRDALENSGRFDDPVVTEILDGATFYKAEEYHQDYYKKNPLRYRFYRASCGRDTRLSELWGRGPSRDLLTTAA